ncbi:hypothetical protein KKB18_02085, partial [bacterium]|nr:hypothetical protein [bacterium]
MMNSRKYLAAFSILVLLLSSYDLLAYVIVLKNGKKIEAKKYTNFGDKIKVIFNKVTLYIPKDNIDYISPGALGSEAEPSQTPAAQNSTFSPTTEVLTMVPEATPEVISETKIEETRISPETANQETISEMPIEGAGRQNIPTLKQKEEVRTQSDRQVIVMRGADKDYFDKWQESDFVPEAWQLYVQAKDMDGEDLQKGIDLLKQALEYDQYNDKIKMVLAEKNGELAWKYYHEKNYIDAQRTFEEAYFLDLSQKPDYCFGMGLCKYNLENYKYAESDLFKAQRRGLESSDLYFYLGNIAEALLRPGDAMQYWEKALEKDYKNQEAWNRILKRSYSFKPDSEHFVIVSLKKGNNSKGIILSRLLEIYNPKIIDDLGFKQKTKFEVFIDPERNFPINRDDPEMLSIDLRSYIYIPCKNIETYSWMLERYLKNSIAYTAIYRATNFNLPEWLANGFSQYESGKRISGNDVKFLLESMVNEELIPITLLSGSFYGLTRSQYELAEIQSLSLF